MNLPLEGEVVRWLAIPFGMAFGYVLHRSHVADYNVIVNQFRLRDATMLKIMLTAIFVGGVGVFALHNVGLAHYHIKPANFVDVGLGAAIFAVGMVLLGYCPGTGIAAVAGGSVHALIGLLGMLAGGVLYGLSYPSIEKHIHPLFAFGKVRLPDITGIPDLVWFLPLGTLLALALRSRRRTANRDRNLPKTSRPPTPVPRNKLLRQDRAPLWDI
jgi:uncharacterized membrane protein YedE/YeeE